jgi:hypothetical protein
MSRDYPRNTIESAIADERGLVVERVLRVLQTGEKLGIDFPCLGKHHDRACECIRELREKLHPAAQPSEAR